MSSDNPNETSQILIIDDTPANLDLLAAFLNENSYRCRAMPNGRLGILSAKTHPPDLILLDINMPDMNGFEVCEALKADAATKDIPIIFISALTDTFDKVKAFTCGAMDYVTKPFQLKEVEARIATHVKLRRLQLSLDKEKQIAQANYRQLKELESTRDLLVNMVVHDMRSPLYAASLALEGMRDMGGVAPDAEEFLSTALAAVARLTLMANTMLDINRLEEGKMPLCKTRTDIRTIAEEAEASARIAAQEKCISMRIQGENYRLSADKDIIQRVIVNLLSNGIKYSPENAILSIELSCSSDFGRIAVIDKGDGIPKELQSQLFTKYGQLEAPKTGVKHSAGLGLTFCKLAVEAHQGRIGVESEPGKGSEFWFELPME